MKKFLLLNALFAIALITSPYALADREHHGRGHHGRGHHRSHYSEDDRYYPQRQYSNYQDPRSHQGLAGGVVGSVLGYEIGNGNPLATGLGAAAGSYLGNGMAGRR